MGNAINIGAEFRAGRKKMGLTLDEVASYINYSPSYINLLENNKRKTPGLEVVSALADLYKLDIDVLRGKKVINSDESIDDCVVIDVKNEIEVSLEQMTDIKVKMDGIILLLEENNDSPLHNHLLKESKNLNHKIKALQKSLAYSFYQVTLK